MYDIAADNGGSHFRPGQRGGARRQDKARAEATDAEKERDAKRRTAPGMRTAHHWLTGAATLIEIGIALSTVAIITRRQPFWFSAMGLGLAGAVLFGAFGLNFCCPHLSPRASPRTSSPPAGNASAGRKPVN